MNHIPSRISRQREHVAADVVFLHESSISDPDVEPPVANADGCTIDVAADDNPMVTGVDIIPIDWVWCAVIMVDSAPLEDARVCSEADITIMLMLADPPMLPPLIPPPIIIVQPNEFLPEASRGQSTLPSPLKRMLLAHRVCIESWVATIRSEMASLVSWNQSFTIGMFGDCSACCMARMSPVSFEMRVYGLSTVLLG